MRDIELKKCSKIALVVVEKHPIWLAGLRSILNGTQFRIVGEAHSCADAAPVVARTNPHLVLFGLSPMMDIAYLQEVSDSSLGVVLVILTDWDDPASKKLTSANTTVEYLPGTIGGGQLIDALTDLAARNGLPVNPVPSDVADDQYCHCSQLPDPITRRELEVLRLLTEGLSNTEIGGTLFVAKSTVKTHVERIISKLGVTNRVQAAVWAIKHGVVTSDEPPDGFHQ